ncbi:hypothetical protein [Dermacoccus barathri]
MREAYVIRAHTPDRRTIRMTKLLREQFGSENVFVAASEVGNAPQDWPSEINVIRLDAQLLQALELREDIRDSGWRCGDYCQAAVFAKLPDVTRI